MKFLKFTIVAAVLLSFSFQCRKQSVDNSFIEISGQLINQNEEPLSNFELFYGVRYDNENIIAHGTEKIFKTDANGNFSVTVVEPNFETTHKSQLNIIFKDTNHYYVNPTAFETEQNGNFIDLSYFAIENQKMAFGTLTLFQ